jgi:membrane-bound ClpP family serine protease
MTRKSLVTLLAAAWCSFVLPLNADTFKNKQTGETFNGFRTQKSTASQTLVYNDTTKKLTPLELRDYEITMDGKGRRNSVVMVSITEAEILLSETITQIVSEAIVKASNTGPQFVLLKIDNPGGRGEYMKSLCTTISKTDNCKVIAYISGGSFGGAYSAAAILAMACDKIYIAPTASMSSLAPFTETSGEDFIKSYSSDNLASFSIFAATLAQQHQRTALLARALLDKKISIVEVSDTDGKKSLIEKSTRQSSQTIVKTLCEGYSEPLEKPVVSADQKASSPAIPADIHSRVLNLTAEDAVRLQLADRIVYSVQDILADMNAADVQVANAPGIDSAVKQFAGARKNIRQRLAKIEILESRVATLEEQLNTLEQQIRTTPATRTQTSNTRGRVRTPDSRYHITDEDGNLTTGRDVRQTGQDSLNYRSQDRTSKVTRSETVTTTESSPTAILAKTELSYVLTDLIGEYRQTINSAKRWVGALPSEIQLQTLEKNMNSAMALSENLRFRP